MNQKTTTPDMDQIVAELKEKFKAYPLFQITDNFTGDVFIIRGSNWDEFSQVGNVKPGKENAFRSIWSRPMWSTQKSTRQDIEYNRSGQLATRQDRRAGRADSGSARLPIRRSQ